MPREPEVAALLALMLLHDSRRAARTDADGELVLLDRQDRSLWDRERIAEGLELVASARRAGPRPYVVQASIAAEHSRAERAEDTDWERIVRLYAWLAELDPSPVIELNRAVAVAMADGPGGRARARRRDRGPRRLRALPRRARRPAAAARAPGGGRPHTSGRRSSRRTRSSALPRAAHGGVAR